MRELLKTEHLSVSFFTKSGEVEAVRDVSLTVEEGEVLAIVGESGCGKSALCKSIMKLLPKTAKIKSGKILADGIDITDYTQRNMSRLRGALFSMIFQDPMTSLNPTMTIGKQIGEAVRIHNKKMPKNLNPYASLPIIIFFQVIHTMLCPVCLDNVKSFICKPSPSFRRIIGQRNVIAMPCCQWNPAGI